MNVHRKAKKKNVQGYFIKQAASLWCHECIRHLPHMIYMQHIKSQTSIRPYGFGNEDSKNRQQTKSLFQFFNL